MSDILTELDYLLEQYFIKHGEAAGSIYLGQAQFEAFKLSLQQKYDVKIHRIKGLTYKGISVYRVYDLLHINCGE